MSYVFLTIISALVLGVYDVLKKVSLKGHKDIYEILMFYTFVAFLCSMFYVNQAFNIEFKYIGFLALKTILISLNWVLTMKAISKLDVGIVVPFSLLGTVSTTILASIFFHEKIGFVQIGGCLVILCGLFLIASLSKKDAGKNDYKYLLLLCLAALLSSFGAIIDKRVLNDISRGPVLFWFFLFLFLIYLVINLIKNKKVNIKNFKSNLWVIAIGVSIFLADFFYYEAVGDSNASLSIISIVRKLSVFIGVVLSSVFLKEKYLLKKIMILLLMFSGLGLILFL